MTELTNEIGAFLAEPRYATLATHDPDSTIHLTPVWYVFALNTFYFESFSGSRKVKNLQQNPAAPVIVDSRQPGSERWVSASGRADIMSGYDAKKINAGIRRRYLTDDALADERIEPIFDEADDVTIRLRPVRWRSWQARDLDEQLFGGILGKTPERWFLPLDL